MPAAKIYVTADLHLGHLKVAQARGFDTTQAHDFELMRRCNSVVSPKDTLIILGDVAFAGQAHLVTGFANIRRLVLGNHDKLNTGGSLQHTYFISVHGYFVYKDMLLSHMPVHESQFARWRKNIHGHLHGGQLADSRYQCVSLEQTNLTPVLLDSLL